MVAHRTLTPFVRVRILHPLPKAACRFRQAAFFILRLTASAGRIPGGNGLIACRKPNAVILRYSRCRRAEGHMEFIRSAAGRIRALKLHGSRRLISRSIRLRRGGGVPDRAHGDMYGADGFRHLIRRRNNKAHSRNGEYAAAYDRTADMRPMPAFYCKNGEHRRRGKSRY